MPEICGALPPRPRGFPRSAQAFRYSPEGPPLRGHSQRGPIHSVRPMPRDVEHYLANLPHILRIPLYNLIVVHAGLHPKRSLDQQTVKDATEMRSLVPTAEGLISSSEPTAEGAAWASLRPGPETVIFGHDAARGLQRHPHAMGIDSRCVKGASLTAVVYPGAQLVSVPGWLGDAKV